VAVTVSMDALHEGIVDACRAHFGARIRQYGAYEPWDAMTDEPEGPALETPALLLEIEGLADADLEYPDPTGRLAQECSWVLHCVLSNRTARLQQTLPQFAAAVLALVRPARAGGHRDRGNLWGFGGAVEEPRNVSAQPAAFTPGLHGRDSWAVRWDQIAYLDDSLPF
jgi:hypothetical protein